MADPQELTPTLLTLPLINAQNQFSISAKNPSQGEIIVSYNGLAGNQPGTYKNSLALWQGALPNTSVGPIKVVPVGSDDQPNAVPFDYAFQSTDYCLTYQVGPDVSTMCALTSFSFALMARLVRAVAFWRSSDDQSPPSPVPSFKAFVTSTPLPFSLQENLPTAVSIKIDKVTTESIQIIYTTLPGYQPTKNGNWIGLWQGFAIPYGGPKPIGRTKITDDYTQGIVTIDKLRLFSGLTYTLIYFMQDPSVDPQFTSASTLLYFSV